MKRFLLLAAFAFTTTVYGQVSIGVRIGAPPAPRIVRVRPVAPGPGYIWVEGYWYPEGRHYKWHAGYWTRPPYEGAVWVGSRYEGGQFFAGYWNGPTGRFDHDHRWDREHDRDSDRRDRR